MLNFNRRIIFDGAMGTSLMNYGFKFGQCVESFNLEKPEIIEKIHLEYLEAGADIITTNTFGANRINLGKHGYKVADSVEAAVKIAKKAIEKYENRIIENNKSMVGGGNLSHKYKENRKLVALDLGPTAQGAPYGEMDFKGLYELFKEQVVVGTKAGADLILVETMLSLEEAKAAILAAKDNSNVPIICTFTFKDNKIMTGESIETIAKELDDLGVSAMGANCSYGAKDLIGTAKEFIKYTKTPIIMQPNAGLPRKVNGENVYDTTPEEFAMEVGLMVQEGVKIVGGCCGTTPEFIKAVKERLV